MSKNIEDNIIDVPCTHSDLNDNLATGIVRGLQDDFDRLDCLIDDPPIQPKISSINVSLDSQFKRAKLDYSDIKPKKAIDDSIV